VVEAEDIAVAVVEGGNQTFEVGHVVGELVEDNFRLGFREGAHLGRSGRRQYGGWWLRDAAKAVAII
jgi:hypothetical protein